MWRIRSGFCRLIVVLMVTNACFAAAAQNGGSRRRTRVRLNVTVLTSSGMASRISPQSLKIEVGGKPCGVAQIATLEGPATIGFIVDSSGSMSNWFRPIQIVNAMKAFVEAAHPGTRYFVAEVNASPMVISDFTTDIASILPVVPQTFSGDTNFFEGIRTAVAFMGSVPGPKALVLLSDGQHTIGSQNPGGLERLIALGDVELYGFFKPLNPYDGWSTRRITETYEPFFRLIQLSGGMVPSVSGDGDDALVPMARTLSDIFRRRIEVQCVADVSNSGWKNVTAEAFGPASLGPMRVVARSRVLLPQPER